MQRVTANQLNVEGDHFPLQRMFANNDFRAEETAAGIFHDGKRLRQNLNQPRLQLIVIFNFGKFFLPGGSLFAQVLVGDFLQLGFELIDDRKQFRSAPGVLD